MASGFEVNLPRLTVFGKLGAPTWLADSSGGWPMIAERPKHGDCRHPD
jgi:hypothetical protein